MTQVDSAIPRARGADSTRIKAAFRALAALAVCFSAASCARGPSTAVKPPRAVVVAEVISRDFRVSEDQSARIFPSIEVNLTPKVAGRVSAIRVEVGGRVAKGESLAELERGDYDAQYRQAKAALEGAKANLARTSDSGQEQQVNQARSAADQAQVAYDDAKSLYEKTRRLFDSGAVAKQQLDDVDARYKSASIQLEAAKRELSLVADKAGSQANDIVTGQVDAASAQLDFAKSQLDATVIRSPIAGLVSYRGIEAGEIVGNSTLAFVVIDDSSVLAEAGLSERQVGHVARGMAVQVLVPALGQTPFDGRVDSVSPAPDPQGQLYSVRVRIPNAKGSIKGGMIAKLKLPLEARPGAVVAPEQALFSESGGDYAFVAAKKPDGSYKAERRSLRLGESDGESVEILEGLTPGELVVVSGKELIADGDPLSTSRQ
jgi:RND family efflux transporter MFP subunit